MRAWIGAAAAAIAAFAGAPSPGQLDESVARPSINGEPANAAVSRLVRDLDSQDPKVREEASRELTTSTELSLKDLERSLHGERGSTLSPEQRYRLFAAAFRRFRSPGEPRAAMGVQFDESVREAGVRLQGTVDGFHSHEALRSGDRIESIGGVRVRDRAHAVAIIVSHDPGDEAEIGLVRDGVPLRVRIRMGARAALNNAVGLTLDALNDAWSIRAARYGESAGVEPGRIVDCGLPPAAWPEPTEQAPRNGAAAAAGGEARGAPDPVLLARALDGARGRPRRFPALRFEGPQAAEQIGQTIQMLRDQAGVIESVIARNEVLLRDPNLSAPRRVQIQQEVDMLRTQLGDLRRAIDDLQRQATRMRR